MCTLFRIISVISTIFIKTWIRIFHKNLSIVMNLLSIANRIKDFGANPFSNHCTISKILYRIPLANSDAPRVEKCRPSGSKLSEC